MKNFTLLIALVVLCSASARAQAKVLTNDPLTGLPVIPTTVTKFGGNEPDRLPDATICKSKMVANTYTLMAYMFTDNYDKAKGTVSATVAWYASHLTGFRKASGMHGNRSQTAFLNADGTTMVMVVGNPGAKGIDTGAFSVTYYRFQPGLSQKALTAIAGGNIVCN